MKKFTVFVLVFVWGLLWTGSCVKADTISEDIVMPNETCTIGKGYIDIGESIKAQGDKGLLGQSKPPSSYDSRTKNQVTSVKNQGGYGTCCGIRCGRIFHACKRKNKEHAGLFRGTACILFLSSCG